MNSTFWAAFGGGASAGLFTLVALLTVEAVRSFLNRPLLKIETRVASIVSAVSASDPQLFVTARNPRTRSVTVTNVGFEYPDGGGFMFLPPMEVQLPREIPGDGSFDIWLPLANVVKQFTEDGRPASDLKWVQFHSATGKTYRRKVEPVTISRLKQAITDLHDTENPRAQSNQ